MSFMRKIKGDKDTKNTLFFGHKATPSDDIKLLKACNFFKAIILVMAVKKLVKRNKKNVCQKTKFQDGIEV